MKKMIGVVLMALALAGCETREEARARNEERLPPGCRIVDMDYGDLRVAVICEGRKTNTSVRAWDVTTYITICDGNGICTQTPQTTRHRHVSVEIGA
jgi:hypothetical protein